MRTVLSRLIHSTPSISRINATVVSISGRNLFFKVEEAETVNVAPHLFFTFEENGPPPPTEKLVVFGGNRFVAKHIFREALDRGESAGSGRSSLHDSWARNFYWYKGNLFSTDSLTEALNGATAVISFMGGFGSNIKAIRAASDQGVILRPGFFYGTRRVGSPLEMVLPPLVGPLMTTAPVNVTAVAKVAVTAATATDPVFPPGIIDAYGIQRLLSEYI
ncbi:Hypothetical protein glysoja_050034 [Glycine soja]|uniref:Uncharacterized protein n=1 Tax=Glycine soja TaxID=3848 RepID=A0A0B2QVU5_GLYSO|nr:Hypothetical protein glysoja_050034 [Glycine soja]